MGSPCRRSTWSARYCPPGGAGSVPGLSARGFPIRSRLPGSRRATAIGSAGWFCGRPSSVWPTGRKSPSSALCWRLSNTTGSSSSKRFRAGRQMGQSQRARARQPIPAGHDARRTTGVALRVHAPYLMPSFTAIQAQTLVEHNPAHFFPPTYSRSIASMIPSCRMVIHQGPQRPVHHLPVDGAGVRRGRSMTPAEGTRRGNGQRPGGTSLLSSSAKCCTTTTSVGAGSATVSSRSMK
jgi:hypothetical protein